MPIGGFYFPFLQDQRPLFYGTYEPQNVKLLRSWLRPGDTFVDVGAASGYLSAIAADVVGVSGAIYAFEPEEWLFARSNRMVDLNPQFKTKIEQCAVCDSAGRVRLWISNHRGWSSLHSEIDDFRETRAGFRIIKNVQSTTLDKYIPEQIPKQNLPVRLVKIDVEGAERAVIRGARRLLQQHFVQALLVEISPRYPTAPLLTELAELGYDPYYYDALRTKRWVAFSSADLRGQIEMFWISRFVHDLLGTIESRRE
jgi:FkbM family methyltransferase